MNEQSTKWSDANAKPSMPLEPERETIEPKYKIALYSNVLANSTSRGLVSPFVSMIAITMGASAGLLGWIQSIANLLSTFLTPLFGRLSDKFKRRIPFILISTVTWGIPYLFLYWAKSPVVVVVIVALVNLLMSLGVPAWNALQNELFPPNVRARMASTIFWFDALGSMIATIFTGIVLSFIFSDTDYQKYILLPVSIGLFFSFLVIIPFSRIEEPLQNMKVEDQPSDFKLKESFLRAFRNNQFRKFVSISMIYSFFWAFAWPLFAIKQVKLLKAKAYEVAILEIFFSIAIMISVRPGAKLSDSIGRTKLIAFNRIVMGVFSLTYIFASAIWHLYLIHIIVATLVMLGSASTQAYLLDIAPKAEGGMYFGIYNMLTGAFLFLGSLTGGYLTQFIERFTGLSTAVSISLAIATVGRFTVGSLFTTLKEVKRFPCTFGEIVQNFITRRRMRRL